MFPEGFKHTTFSSKLCRSNRHDCPTQWSDFTFAQSCSLLPTVPNSTKASKIKTSGRIQLFCPNNFFISFFCATDATKKIHITSGLFSSPVTRFIAAPPSLFVYYYYLQKNTTFYFISFHFCFTFVTG